jgi:hypothetical protein
LGQIKNDVKREIEALKSVLSHNELMLQRGKSSASKSSTAYSSFTSNHDFDNVVIDDDISSISTALDSIKSSIKLNEKLSSIKIYNDKFGIKINHEAEHASKKNIKNNNNSNNHSTTDDDYEDFDVMMNESSFDHDDKEE